MAAWADRALPADEAAAVELHLSNCDRCQEVLAAFIRSAPQAGAVVLPFWARRPVQWSAAGLAAAAALVAMVWIGRPPATPVPESTVASKSVTQGQQPPSAPATVDQLQDRAAAEKPASAAEPRRDRSSAPRALDEKAAANQALAKKVEGRVAAAAPPPPAPAPVAAPVVAAPPVTATPPPARVGLAGGVAGRATSSEAFAADAVSVIAPTFEIVAPDPNSPSQRLMARGAGRGGSGAASALSQSPGPARWRVVAGIRVERSLDAGATWISLPIEPALTTTLRAGAATSQSNCWLVGGEGVVLVTHDGQTFRRVSVPEVVTLTAVTATDGMRAAVTTRDGRTFSTIDGGLTWK